ncbi:hypothetical protein LSAT2_025943, partial [Lamellibrachia satsuma]
MLAAQELGYTNGEYVFLDVELFPFKGNYWGDHGWYRGDSDDARAKAAYDALLRIGLYESKSPLFDEFSTELKRRAKLEYGFDYGQEKGSKTLWSSVDLMLQGSKTAWSSVDLMWQGSETVWSNVDLMWQGSKTVWSSVDLMLQGSKTVWSSVDLMLQGSKTMWSSDDVMLQGMNFIHSSAVHSHGRLRSSNCVIDSRFVLKLTDFGLPTLYGSDDCLEYTNVYQHNKKLLWRAPEHLRHPMPENGSQPGDVYSFGIVLGEIMTREGPYETELGYLELE